MPHTQGLLESLFPQDGIEALGKLLEALTNMLHLPPELSMGILPILAIFGTFVLVTQLVSLIDREEEKEKAARDANTMLTHETDEPSEDIDEQQLKDSVPRLLEIYADSDNGEEAIRRFVHAHGIPSDRRKFKQLLEGKRLETSPYRKDEFYWPEPTRK